MNREISATRDTWWLVRVGAALLALLVLAVSFSPAVASAQGCLQPELAEEQKRLWMLRTIANAPSGQPAMYQLHTTDSSEVYWISDISTCLQAARAVAAHFEKDTLSPPAVYLLRLGPTRYLTFNDTTPAYVVLDAEFGYVTRIRMGGYPD
jgi:hypothetical protein